MRWGLRRDHVKGTSDAPVGQTPVVRATRQRVAGRMISAITNCGQLIVRVVHGTFRAPMFVDFMHQLRAQSAGKVYLIVDARPTHRSRLAQAFAAATAAEFRLIPRPGSCPELNPDALLKQDTKANALWKSRPRTRLEMTKSLFQERLVRYAAA